MIIVINAGQVDQVITLMNEVVHKMESDNIFQWDDKYPDRQTIEDDIRNQTMYGYMDDGVLCGMIVLNEMQSPEYAHVNWKYKDDKPLVVHRLCVKPAYQGRGIATKLIIFSEEYAKERMYKNIRLDAFIQNPAAVGLYRKLNYTEVGVVEFRKGRFYCFEKHLPHWKAWNH